MDSTIPAGLEPNPSHVSRIADRVIDLRPKLPGNEKAFRKFCRSLAKEVEGKDAAGRRAVLERSREYIYSAISSTISKRQLALNFTCSVIVDMVAQGWVLSVGYKRASLHPPSTAGVSPEDLKQRVRDGHLLERDAQLRETAVRDFIREMETRRLGPRGWVSIFSLMRDGRELAVKLRSVTTDPTPNRQMETLRLAVAPYLQLVENGVRCEHTGMLLTEIWRYFRHTWASTYKSLPGRSMMLLVRDAAAPCHPIIGIAALGSSMAQQTQRDQWIGWDSATFVNNLTLQPTEQMAIWVENAISRLIKAIYIKDFLKERIIKRSDLRFPSARAIERLTSDAERSSRYHVLNPDSAKHKRGTGTKAKVDWESQSKTPLFRSKRGRALARLLEIRTSLPKPRRTTDSVPALRNILATREGKAAIGQLVRLVKAEHVGVNMMDIIVCGSVAPYNAILGGKLVCLLLGSPELVKFYRERYGTQSSIIASSMKGRPVIRVPNLVLLATTSLYGVVSSQYNRIKVPLEEIGGKAGDRLEYLELGVSKGYGSYHFSQSTIDYLETLLGRASDGRKVNSIFGEGVNPLMRKIRGGLDEVGLPADELLKHGNTRAVYGIQLAYNFRDVLIGLSDKPRYFLSPRKVTDSTQKLAEYWRKRWLAGRIARMGVLEALESHTLAYPVTHGARVTLPSDGQLDLFDPGALP